MDEPENRVEGQTEEGKKWMRQVQEQEQGEKQMARMECDTTHYESLKTLVGHKNYASKLRQILVT